MIRNGPIDSNRPPKEASDTDQRSAAASGRTVTSRGTSKASGRAGPWAWARAADASRATTAPSQRCRLPMRFCLFADVAGVTSLLGIAVYLYRVAVAVLRQAHRIGGFLVIVDNGSRHGERHPPSDVSGV